MQKDPGYGAPSTPTARLRRRKGSTEALPEVDKSNGDNLLVNDRNKYKSFLIRTYSTVWMIGGFTFVIYMRHLYIWAMVVVIQIFMAKELFNLLRRASAPSRIQDLKLSAFTVANIFEGIFWFLLPASLIIVNDVAAYIFGFFLGKTPLIKLSPKKTWEGFIGASVATVISAFFDLSSGWLHCDPGTLFRPVEFALPEWFPEWFPWKEISVLAVQWHALCLGLFASIIAPFGGFFASGFKRAFNIKDFGDSIPGHGGITDRMDCQMVMVMAVFAYIYHQAFVVPQNLTLEIIIDQILAMRSNEICTHNVSRYVEISEYE
ncbi:hypothetical protein SASPL_145509 [Salvia splendens]|uniref:Phosphatidate cytidylyltransferase n=1 Tax=Salvia splendens TaxID=180675 RepID=A0A8X8Z854_SALSN|nr:hypothetical protein SASPL_145509 [Salvia splendens]